VVTAPYRVSAEPSGRVRCSYWPNRRAHWIAVAWTCALTLLAILGSVQIARTPVSGLRCTRDQAVVKCAIDEGSFVRPRRVVTDLPPIEAVSLAPTGDSLVVRTPSSGLAALRLPSVDMREDFIAFVRARGVTTLAQTYGTPWKHIALTFLLLFFVLRSLVRPSQPIEIVIDRDRRSLSFVARRMHGLVRLGGDGFPLDDVESARTEILPARVGPPPRRLVLVLRDGTKIAVSPPVLDDAPLAAIADAIERERRLNPSRASELPRAMRS
jgi:hypothetical protein